MTDQQTGQQTGVTQDDADQLERFAQQNLEGTKLSEILTGIPPLLLRGVIYMSCAAVVLTFALLYFGKVYTIVTATGKVVPEGDSILIQSLDGGVVREVSAKAGDRVAAGAPLLKLDVTRSGLNVTSLTRKQQLLDADVRLLRQSEADVNQLLAAPETWLRQREPMALASVVSTAVQDVKRAWLTLQTSQKVDRVGFPEKKAHMLDEIELDKKKIELLQKDLKQTNDEIAAEEQSLERKRTKLEEFKKLATERGLYSRLEVEDEEERFRLAAQAVADHRKARNQKELDLSNERLRLARSDMDVRAEEQNTSKDFQLAETGYHDSLNALRTALGTLRQTALQKEADLTTTREELQAAHGQMAFSSIASPVAGTVTEIKVRNSGEIVAAGQAVAVIVPEGVPLVIDAEVPDHDIGFVRAGCPVHIKVKAFPFEQFGILEGKVLKVFPNAGEGDKFAVKIGLDSAELHSGNQSVRIFPGLTVQVDVLTSRTRLLALLFGKAKR